MPEVSTNRFSWVIRSDLRELNGIQFWEYFESPEFPSYPPSREDDSEYTIQSGDRIDNLAYRFYGDSQLWWVIALANDLRLLPNELYQGRVIKVPSPQFVQENFVVRKST